MMTCSSLRILRVLSFSLVLFFVFFVTEAFTQGRQELRCINPIIQKVEKERILNGVQNAYRGLKTMAADFNQYSYLAVLDTEEVSTGSVVFLKPGSMRWEYRSPEPQLFISKEGVLWFYSYGDKQIIIDNFSNAFTSELPVSFLMGIGDIKKDFILESICSTKRGLRLDLKSSKKGKDASFNGFALLVDKKSLLPLGAEIVDGSDNITLFIWENLKINSPVSNTRFDWPKVDNVDIIDRRKD